VAASPWKGGAGDVVGELAAAARAEGIGLGLYLSPWDRHEPVYGDTVAYNEHYLGQMTELLTRYVSDCVRIARLLLYSSMGILQVDY
jgi:alpha-L-fucosidase